MDDYDMIREKLKFLNDQGMIHLSVGNKRFYNGTIVSFLPDGIIFKDRKLGSLMLFYKEIDVYSIAAFKEDKKEGGPWK